MSKQKVTLRIEEGEVELLKLLFNTDNQSEAIRLAILQSLATEDSEKLKTLFPYIGKKPPRIGREVVNAFEQSGCKIFVDLFCGSLAMLCYLPYWILLDDIITSLLEGKLYRAERFIRKLLCRVFHYAKIRHPLSDKEFSTVTLKKLLDDEYQDIYRLWIYELSRLQNFERETVDCFIRQKINELSRIMTSQADDIFTCLPKYFLDKDVVVSQTEKHEKNVFIDSIRGRRIEFDTIHGVKGETHDATLYLETDRQRASDLNRILPYYGVGKIGESYLFDYSRKLAYVGMSRPKKLLCVAMQDKTYEKSKGVFTDDWEIIDLRE